MRSSRGLVAVCLVLAMGAVSWVHGQTTSGSILGDVTDSSGAVLAGVQVDITNEATGAVRATQTNAAGAYRVTGLAPGTYTAVVTRAQFSPVTRRAIVVAIQGEAKIDFEMELGPPTQEVLVVADAPLMRPTESTLQTVVDNERIDALPLLTRDFMDLALQAPGVALDQSSVRSGTTDSISFFGLEESAKSIWLEGVDFGDEVTTGGTNTSKAPRTRLSQEAIQEFQVMNTGYSPEFGRTGGGAINAVLKSGGNEIHGSAFYFFRDDALDATPRRVSGGEAVEVSDVPDVRRHSFGGTIGGPIVQDEIFYFLSFERLTKDENAFTPTGDPALGEVVSFVEGLGLGYDTRSVVPQNRDQIQGIGKLTFQLNEEHKLDLTYIYDDDDDFANGVAGPAAADFGFDRRNSSYFASASLTSLLGTGTVNELRVNRSQQRLIRTIPEGSFFLPQLDFPSISFGTNGEDGLPDARVQKNFIVANTTSHQFGNHTVRWGGEVNVIDAVSDTNVVFNGRYIFNTDIAPFAADTYIGGINLQFERGEVPDASISRMNRDIDAYSAFVNDTWRVTPSLTVNLGLRWDLRVLRGDLGGRDPFEQPGFSREDPEDVWLSVALGSAGTLPVDNWRPVPTDVLDLSPRIGFALDLFGSGDTVIRGSYGIYHDRLQTARLDNAVNGYNELNTQTIRITDDATIAGFFPTVPDAGSFPGNIVPVGQSTVPSPTTKTAYNQHFNIGAQHRIQDDMVFSADFTHILVLNQVMRRNVNAPMSNGVFPFGPDLIAAGFPEDFVMRLSHDSSGRGQVNSATFRLERRMSDFVGFVAGYTLGSAKQFDRSGFFGIEPTDPYDIYRDIDYGPMDNDVRHRLTFSALVELPYDVDVSTLITANSAPPFNKRAFGGDVNGDSFFQDRPPGVGFNSLRGEAYFNADLRVSKVFLLDEARNVEVLYEMFNLFNTENLTNFNSFSELPQSVLPSFQSQIGARFNF